MKRELFGSRLGCFPFVFQALVYIQNFYIHAYQTEQECDGGLSRGGEARKARGTRARQGKGARGARRAVMRGKQGKFEGRESPIYCTYKNYV